MLNTVQLQIFRAFYILLIFFIISIFDYFHLSCQGGLILKKNTNKKKRKTQLIICKLRNKKKNDGCHQPIDFLGTKDPEQYIFNNGLNSIKKKTQRPKIIMNGSCFGFKDMK